MKKNEKEKIVSSVVQQTNGKVSVDQINEILDSLPKTGSPWWVVLLKVVVYAIGLILAGYGTTAAAASVFHF